MRDFVNNKISLGKVIFTAKGGISTGIPVHSPAKGILNIQYTINEI